jgi:predicted enzyme related to lactoylglutathione lyase
MSSEKECPQAGQFSWNELVAIDEAVAKKFYTGLFGWKTEAFGGPANYTLFKQGDTMVGGMMKCPDPGGAAHWLAYVTVDDVDATAATAAKLGGKIVVEPFDVPTVGRIAVLVDPQGAAIGIFKAVPGSGM